MNDWISEIKSSVDPLPDSIYGDRYRCSLTLKDGTYLPCALLQSKQHVVSQAKKRISEEFTGKGILGGPDPFGQIVSVYAASGNRVADYDVLSASESPFAIPLDLLRQIHGETTMGWTGWVFKMLDGKLFSYGSTFHMEFFQLPEGYSFGDVEEVINHSYVNREGDLQSLVQGGGFPDDYDINSVFRERTFFRCAVDGI